MSKRVLPVPKATRLSSLMVRVSAAELVAFHAYASSQGVTVSTLIRSMLRKAAGMNK